MVKQSGISERFFWLSDEGRHGRYGGGNTTQRPREEACLQHLAFSTTEREGALKNNCEAAGDPPTGLQRRLLDVERRVAPTSRRW